MKAWLNSVCWKLAVALGFIEPPRLQPIVYYMIHFTLNMICTLLSWVLWHSFFAHTAFLAVLLYTATWNGATYTFKIFAVRYCAQKMAAMGYTSMDLTRKPKVQPQKMSLVKLTLNYSKYSKISAWVFYWSYLLAPSHFHIYFLKQKNSTST